MTCGNCMLRFAFRNLISRPARSVLSLLGLTVAIAGEGRDTGRLQKLIDQLDAPVTLLGRIGDDDLVDLYAAGDVFSMLCRTPAWAARLTTRSKATLSNG